MDIRDRYLIFEKSFVANYKSTLSRVPLHLRHLITDSTFLSVGFSDQESQIESLYHYSGGMHKLDDLDICDVNHLITPRLLTAFEKTAVMYRDLDKWYSKNVSSRESRYDQPIFCPASAVRSLLPSCAIARIYEGSKLNILDIGTGSGYFAILNSFLGHNIMTLDRSVGFNCWQELLFMYQKLFSQNIKTPVRIDPFEALAGALHKKTSILSTNRFDLITFNHCINELGVKNLYCYLGIILQELSIDESPLIIIEGWGWGSRINNEKNTETFNVLRYYGYELIYNDSNITFSKHNNKSNSHTLYVPVAVLQRKKTTSFEGVVFRTSETGHAQYFHPYEPVHGLNLAIDRRLTVKNETNLSSQAGQDLHKLIERVTLDSGKRIEERFVDTFTIAEHPTRLYPSAKPGMFF